MLTAIIVIAVIIILIFLAVNFVYSAVFGARCEGNPKLKYFSHDDFEHLSARGVSFLSDKGQTLRGYVYSDTESVQKGLIVFAHGMGGGHLSYTSLINTFAAAGFYVLAYDNTGTMSSEGKSLVSFYQAVKDLRAALRFASGDEALSGYNPVIVGHSWGAYAVCQALAFEEAQVSGAVAFSPPDSTDAVICDYFYAATHIPAGWLRPFVRLVSYVRGGKAACRRTSDVLKNTVNVPVMILQGDKDADVTLKNSPVSSEAVRAKENIICKIYKGRAHNVYQTVESEKYLGEVFGAISSAEKKYGKGKVPPEVEAELYNIDYRLAVKEDPGVIAEVIEFINQCVE